MSSFSSSTFHALFMTHIRELFQGLSWGLEDPPCSNILQGALEVLDSLSAAHICLIVLALVFTQE